MLHIQCPADLALLGVDASNYERIVLDRATWEQRYGFRTDQLPYDDFRVDPTPPVGPALPPPSSCDDFPAR